jgi:hypothetical protein
MTGTGAGQPRVQLAQREARQRIPPPRREHGRGPEDERTLAEQRVRDGQIRASVGTAAPQYEVDVEYPRRPALSARAASEGALEALGELEHGRGIERGFDQRGGIGIATQRRTDWIGQKDGCRRKHSDALVCQPFERGPEYVARPSKTMMAPVRTQREQVKLRQMSSQMRP